MQAAVTTQGRDFYRAAQVSGHHRRGWDGLLPYTGRTTHRSLRQSRIPTSGPVPHTIARCSNRRAMERTRPRSISNSTRLGSRHVPSALHPSAASFSHSASRSTASSSRSRFRFATSESSIDIGLRAETIAHELHALTTILSPLSMEARTNENSYWPLSHRNVYTACK